MTANNTQPKRRPSIARSYTKEELSGLDIFNRGQLAAYLGVSIRTIDNWTKANRIPHTKLSRTVRYDIAEVRKALSRHTIKAVSAI